jgi:hypothetical protein
LDIFLKTMKEEESQNRNSDAAAFKIGPGKPREPVPFMIQILLITGIRCIVLLKPKA